MSVTTRLTVVGAVAAALSVLPLLDATTSADWLASAVIAVAAVVATGHAARKLGVPALVTPLAQLVVLVLWLGVLVAGDVALLGFVPTPDWASRLLDVFGEGAATVNSHTAPVPAPAGILALLVGGSGLVALLVDVTAVALRRAPLAGVPLAACYAVTATVLPGGVSWQWFLPPAAGFLALLITEGRGRIAAWGRPTGVAASAPSPAGSVPPRVSRADSLTRNGRRVSVLALVAAVAVPGVAPVLTEGVLQISGRGGGGGGQTIRTDNPIVDLQRNLQRPENVELLRYRASTNAPSYIRIVTLDVFDGEQWETSDRPVPDSVTGGLPWPQGLRQRDLPVADYAIQITDNLSSSWLPLPYPARQVDIDGDWRYHAQTLDVVANDDDVRGKSYQVRSLAVEPTREMLRAAGEPDDNVASSLELPDDLPAIVTEQAAAATAGATDDWGRAVALQQWFRSAGGFIYDIEAQAGHSESALADFLTERRGYCEQFAASMAIMARHLGIPSRVAVGFTPGDYLGDDTWQVRAHDSHAWPELYFEGVGWVPFEPTPASRTGMPPEWTVAPPDNDSDRPQANPLPVPQPSATGPSMAPGDDVDAGGALPGEQPPAQWPLIVLSLAAAALLVSAPWLFARFARELRWRRADGDPAATAEAAWADLRETARDAGLRWDPTATPRVAGRELAAAAALGKRDRSRMDRIVKATELARFARQAQPAPSLRADAVALRRAVMGSRSAGRRVLAFLTPSWPREAVRDLARRLADGLDWLDSTGDRARARVSRTG